MISLTSPRAASLAKLLISRVAKFAAIHGPAFISFLVPAIAAYFYNINFLYNRGGYTWDAGVIAEVIGRPSLTLPISPVLDIFSLGSFYRYHFPPGLMVLSWISGLFPFSPPQFFALFLGVTQGVLGITVYSAIRFGSAESVRKFAGNMAIAAIAILAAFGGPMLATMGFPHFEAIIPALIMAFLVLRAMGARTWALCAFIACLTIREDAGLHLALVLGLIAFDASLEDALAVGCSRRFLSNLDLSHICRRCRFYPKSFAEQLKSS